MKKKHIFWMRVIIGLSILAILYTKVGFMKVISSLENFNVAFIIVAIVFFLVSLVLSFLAIAVLLKGVGYEVKIKHFFKYCLSWSVGTVSPGRLGDFSLGFIISNKKSGFGTVSAIVLLDKLITILTYAIVFIGSISFVFGSNIISSKEKWTLGGIFFCLVITCLLIILNNAIREKIKRYLPRKVSTLLKGFSRSVREIVYRKPWHILLNLCFTLMGLVMNALIYQVILKGFGESISFMFILLTNILNKLVSLIPITIAGLGVRESVGTYLYTTIGVEAHVMGGLFLITLLIAYGFSFIVLLIMKE